MSSVDAVLGRINVQIDGLASAAALIRDELEQGYRSQVPQVYEAMGSGATIGGAIVGAEWMRLQYRYTACIQTTVDALYNLDLGTQAVARAAEVISGNYRDADALAQATVQEVRDVLPAPPGQESTVTPPPAGGAQHG